MIVCISHLCYNDENKKESRLREMYRVIKRDGQFAEFDLVKISKAITKAFESQNKQYHPQTIDFI